MNFTRVLVALLAVLACAVGAASAPAADFFSDATVTNVNYGTEQVVVHGPAHVTFDNVTWGAFNANSNSYEGRLQVLPGASVTVKNSKFGPGGCSDGLQYSSSVPSEVYNTEFTGISQSCSASQAHVDPVQLYAGDNLNFHDNWIHGGDSGIMAPDGSSGNTFKNNVIVAGNNYDIVAGNMDNSVITHNVADVDIYDGNPTNQPGCGSRNSSGDTYRDNVGTLSGCGTNLTADHNLASVTFTGGTGRCAFATASPKGTASDGTDIGLNDCGGTPPPADADGDGVPDSSDLCPGTPAGTPVDASGCPFGPPPTDHTPVARFTASPEPSSPGQTVTFNGTASTCEDAPCTYHWHDINGGDWPLGPDGATSTIAFQAEHPASSPVMAELVLTDADGDVARVEHDHVVTTTAPPPDTTPPDTTITSAPSNGTSTSASVSFTGTDNVGVDHFDCQLDGGAYAVCTSPKSYTGLSVGSHTVNVKAVDAAGNADATPATATWTVSAPPTSGPPTFKAEYESAWNTTANKSVSVPVVAGDVLVAYAGSQDSPNALSIGGTGLTWSLAKSSNARASAYVWTATATSTITATVNVTDSATSWHYGVDVLKFGNSTGIGASSVSAAMSTTLTTTKDSSAIVKFVTDWSAQNGSGRNSLTAGVGAFTETTYQLDAGQYSSYGGYHANVGAIGSKTVGYNAPTGMTANTIAVEVKGT